jgi:hypothetical protein
LQKKPNKVNIHTLNIESKKTPNLNDIANTFNKYFTEVADYIHKHIKDLDPNDNFKPMNYMSYLTSAFESPLPSIKITETTNREIKRLTQSLKSSHTHGYDEISNNILKICKTFISQPVSYLCGGRSVGIVRSRTKGHGVCLFLFVC